MFMLITTGDYDSFTSCTDNENDDFNINFKYLLPSIPGSVLLLSLIGLIICTTLKPLIPNK